MMGSFATVSPALTAFPDLLIREDTRDQAGGLRWRRMVVAPSARPPRTPVVEADVRLGLQPFGPGRDISVNGVPRNIGRMKIVELLAYLALHPDGTERGRLQQVLFPEATLRNGGNHFRQISFKFRQITGLSLDRRDGNHIGLPAGTVVDAADVRFEELLRTVSWGTPADRVTLLRAALDLVPGAYLGGSNLAWAEERRAHLDVVQEEARLELVRVLLEMGEPEAARTECRALLALNHYSDPGYRLLVQIERTIGSESSVFAAYREAVTALEELGLAPGAARELMKAEPPSPRRRTQLRPARPLVRP
jgi:DNA-binding SARP family transcriptional activator